MPTKTSEEKARRELIEVCHLCYERGYITGTEGNFSIRLGKNLILTTPRGTCKGRIKASELLLTDMKGATVSGSSRGKRGGGRLPSTELKMHLIAYELRKDVDAVCHAHPTTAVAFSVADKSLSKCILPEVVCTLGRIPVAPYATPSTDEIPESISPFISKYDAIVLDHHGALAVGKDIFDAYYKLETLEHHAQTLFMAHMLGGAKPLYASSVKKLLDICGVYGLQKPPDAHLLTAADMARADWGDSSDGSSAP